MSQDPTPPAPESSPPRVRWVIQDTLGKSQEIEALVRAVRAQNHEVTRQHVIPFSDELPQLPQDAPTLFYGSARWTWLIAQAGLWRPGVYFDEAQLRYSTCLAAYGQDMLNHSGELLSVAQIAQQLDPHDDQQQRFVRPDADLKSFAGEVMSIGALARWAQRILDVDSPTLPPDALIYIDQVRHIDREWRLFIVDGQIATATRYRSQGRLEQLAEQPPEVIAFAQGLIQRWSPLKAFVMDVGLSQGKLSVIECNGIQSSGFYAANISAFVRAMSALAIEDFER